MSKQESNVIIFALVLIIALIMIKPLVAALLSLAALVIFTVYRYLKIKKII